MNLIDKKINTLPKNLKEKLPYELWLIIFTFLGFNVKSNLFDTTKLKKDKISLIIGSNKYEKNILIKDILYNKKNEFNKRIVIETNDPFYSQFFPEILIHKNITDSIFNHLFQQQLTNRNNFIVLDDGLTKYKNNDNIRQLIYNHRFYNLSVFINEESICKIRPVYHQNLDYIFIFKPLKCYRNKLYEYYHYYFNSFNDFNFILDNIDTCLIIDNTFNYPKKLMFYNIETHDNLLFS